MVLGVLAKTMGTSANPEVPTIVEGKISSRTDHPTAAVLSLGTPSAILG
jgi:hypothetical protein